MGRERDVGTLIPFLFRFLGVVWRLILCFAYLPANNSLFDSFVSSCWLEGSEGDSGDVLCHDMQRRR